MENNLFRGKKRYGKGWAYGVPLELDINGMKVPAIVSGARKSTDGFVLDYDEVLAETVGMDTGLTDKKGKKIFYGDILFDKEHNLSWVVEFSKEEGLWALGESDALEAWQFSEMEIIGNIHDNPELVP